MPAFDRFGRDQPAAAGQQHRRFHRAHAIAQSLAADQLAARTGGVATDDAQAQFALELADAGAAHQAVVIERDADGAPEPRHAIAVDPQRHPHRQRAAALHRFEGSGQDRRVVADGAQHRLLLDRVVEQVQAERGLVALARIDAADHEAGGQRQVQHVVLVAQQLVGDGFELRFGDAFLHHHVHAQATRHGDAGVDVGLQAGAEVRQVLLDARAALAQLPVAFEFGGVEAEVQTEQEYAGARNQMPARPQPAGGGRGLFADGGFGRCLASSHKHAIYTRDQAPGAAAVSRLHRARESP